jgi:ribosome-associated heat shock protein Hsp15
MQQDIEKICRLDKWLWAARFFKTRSIAADAVDGGKVRVDGQRAKNAKEIKIGMIISIKTRDIDIEVEVTGLSNVRRGAPEAALLYAETPQSVSKKTLSQSLGAHAYAERERGTGRPTKRALREIKKFTHHF